MGSVVSDKYPPRRPLLAIYGKWMRTMRAGWDLG
jgi:hypothetical protein